MLSLLVLVFLLQLITHLANTVFAKSITELLWTLSTRIPAQTSNQAQRQLKLKAEVVRLKREMNAVSAQDDFARWAKIRREHDRVLAEHDKVASSLSSARSSFDTKASVFRWLSTNGLRFAIQFYHAKTPVFTLPPGWFPWWVEWLLGFPRCPYGGVSVNVWSAACATVITLVSEGIKWLTDQVAGTTDTKTEVKNGMKMGPLGSSSFPSPAGSGSGSGSVATGRSTKRSTENVRARKAEL